MNKPGKPPGELAEHAMYYDDRDLIAQVYPVLKRLLGYFESYRSAERGLIGQVPGWVVLDHPDTYPMNARKLLLG